MREPVGEIKNIILERIKIHAQKILSPEVISRTEFGVQDWIVENLLRVYAEGVFQAEQVDHLENTVYFYTPATWLQHLKYSIFQYDKTAKFPVFPSWISKRLSPVKFKSSRRTLKVDVKWAYPELKMHLPDQCGPHIIPVLMDSIERYDEIDFKGEGNV